MNYRAVLFLFLTIFLVGTVNAMEWDNIKRYDETSKTVTIKNSFFGVIPSDTILEAKLDTPQVYKVAAGYQKVAQFTIKPYASYENLLKQIELYDIKNDMKKIQRRIDIKYLKINEVEVDDYRDNCVFVNNGTNLAKSCTKEKIGSHIEKKEEWLDWDNNIYNLTEVTIGLFTEVQVGDKIEWIPSLAGVRVNEWAIWEASLEVGLISWHRMNYSSGNFIDALGNYNTFETSNFVYGTISPVIANREAVNGTSSSWAKIHDNWILAGQSNLTYSAWFKKEGNNADFWGSGLNYQFADFYIWGDTLIARFKNGGQSSTINYSGIQNNVWYHVVLVKDRTGSGKLLLYLNGNNVANATDTVDSIDNEGYTYWGFLMVKDGGYKFIGTVDEIAMWRRALTPSEVSLLYNEGRGCTYGLCDAPITLNSPSDNSTLLIKNINFSAFVNVPQLSNVTIEVWNMNGTLSYKNTNTSGTNEVYYNWTNINLDYGYYNWTVYGYDVGGIRYSAVNGPFFLNVTRFLVNNSVYNLTTSETSKETFTINIAVAETLSITSASLVLNGTQYPASVAGFGNNNYSISRTVDIPLTGVEVINQSFYFNIIFNDGSQNTSMSNQTITQTIFGLCNSTLTTKFLNITFKDEDTLSPINASIPTSTFVYYLGDGSINKTLTYSETQKNYNYTFCGTPSNRNFKVHSKVQYKQDPDYPQRIWEPSLTIYNSTMKNQVLYLLNVNDGIFVTYQVVNPAGQPIQGVDVTISRVISGETVVIGVGQTDSAGLVTFWVNPDFVHKVTFKKSGYKDFDIDHFPTQSSYTITLTQSSGEIDDFTYGVYYSAQPKAGTTLEANTNVNFSFVINSTYWNLTSFQFSLYDQDNNLIGGNISTGKNYGVIINIINVSNASEILMIASWRINSTDTKVSFTWKVRDSSLSSWSIKTFFSDLSLYANQGMLGLTSLSLSLIIFLVIFLITGILSYKFGLTSPAVIFGIIFVLVYFFDVGLGLIPSPLGGVKHFVTIFFSLIMIAIIIKEVTT